jgi:hypothetical protein
MEKSHQKGRKAASAEGPSDWKNTVRKHCEAPNIAPQPPRDGRILLKSKKFVNACLLTQIAFTKKTSQGTIVFCLFTQRSALS